MTDLTPEDWDAIVDALEWAADEMGEDLYDTEGSDFYDPDERAVRERKQENWMRLAALLSQPTPGGDE